MSQFHAPTPTYASPWPERMLVTSTRGYSLDDYRPTTAKHVDMRYNQPIVSPVSSLHRVQPVPQYSSQLAQPPQLPGQPFQECDGYYLQNSGMSPQIPSYSVPSSVDHPYIPPRPQHQLHVIPRGVHYECLNDHPARDTYIHPAMPRQPAHQIRALPPQSSLQRVTPEYRHPQYREDSPPPPPPPPPQRALSHHGTLPEKSPTLACYFCRARKIACGRPIDGSSCNQCTKRHLKCEYPAGSRRGQHARGTKKKQPPLTMAHPMADSDYSNSGVFH